jgi:prepilin-type N-terminal cleavage/methylation domain-containing protein
VSTKRNSAGRNRVRAGFTLLEVMISIAILSLALSTIFGSSVLAARGTAHARYVTQAALHAQCRMTQLELKVRRDKLPADDQTYEDPVESGDEPCCPEGFTCTARLEKIELPSPATVDTATGNALLDRAAQQARGTTFGGEDAGSGSIGQLAGAMGALSSGGAMGFGAPTGGGGGGGGAGGLAGNGAPDIGGIATQMLSTIYPTLKPTLEGAIRKATVTITWHEGSREFSFQVVQYITNPGQTVQAESGPINGPSAPPPPANPTASATITR